MVERLGTAAIASWADRDRLARLSDRLAVAVAVSLPWSTTATGILVPLWALALLPTLDLATVRRTLASPAAGLPVVLWLLGLLGMLWSDVDFVEKFTALKSFHKLLAIPLLLIQFRRSDKGSWVLGGFLASCIVVLIASWLNLLWPALSTRGWRMGIPVKDYIVQSGEFLICAFALTHLAFDAWRTERRGPALALAALALVFLANIVFVATGRSSLVAFAALVVIIGLQRFGWRGALGIVAAGVVLASVAWTSSAYLRERVIGAVDEIQQYQTADADTSAGYRLEFWKKCIEFTAAAPFLGHGTGSINEQFRRAATGASGASAAVTGNPHNMTLEISVQFGLVGVVVLYAMWAAHLMLFRGRGLAAWIGLGVVVQDIVGSLFLSHLFDFTTGWIYVFGVGVLGGMVLGAERPQSRREPDLHAAGGVGPRTPVMNSS